MNENKPKKRNDSNNNEDINMLDVDEISNRIKNFEPNEIKDFIKRPFKTIAIVTLLII